MASIDGFDRDQCIGLDGVGADLPAPTLFVMGISEIFVEWWWLILISIFGFVAGRCGDDQLR